MSKKQTQCSGEGCPLLSTCQRYNPYVDKATQDHFTPIPYQHEKGRPFPSTGQNCFYYIKMDDPLQQLNLTSQ